MMYKCIECGHIFKEPVSWKEDQGPFWGMPAYEEFSGCPRCRGDYEEIVEDDESEDENDESEDEDEDGEE